jgi:pyroglutamyl-peptidase
VNAGIMKALVTGFEPFGGETLNASREAVLRLPRRVGAIEVETAILPTSYARSLPALDTAIAKVRPDLVLCVGQASDRTALCIERVAVNLQDARIADNDGARPVDLPVVAGGPAAYLSTLPVRAAVTALHAAKLPAQMSMSAGTFVCNHVFYEVMHLAAKDSRRFRAGFLHVPGTASMALEDIVRGIVIVLEASADSGLKSEGGSRKSEV